jgi:hypothetical protein
VKDRKAYRLAGGCALASIVVFLVEFPFYLVRGPFPAIADEARLLEFTARNATNIMACVLLDFVILTLLTVFLAGFRRLILDAERGLEWLATLFFGVGLVYVTLTLVADSLQAATVVDACSPGPRGLIIRVLIEGMYLMYGSVALFLMAFMMALAGHLTLAAKALPRWSGWLGYLCALGCLVFVPSMFVRHVDPMGFYNPAGWGSLAIASGLPLAVWMVAAGVLMMRVPSRSGGTGAPKGT